MKRTPSSSTSISSAVDVEAYRARLFRTAYRMLGSRDDAEDAVQEAYLRWQRLDASSIDVPEAWLVTVVTRLCLDRLREIAKERERYTGSWLAEPLVGEEWNSPTSRLEIRDDISSALLVMLERLSPQERAAFLLYEVFDYSHAEIARVIEKSEAACRQMLHRARERVHAQRARFAVDEDVRRELIGQFLGALADEDEAAVLALMRTDAVYIADGGGKTPTAINVIEGPDRIWRLLSSLSRKLAGHVQAVFVPINGETGLALYLDGALYGTLAFAIEDGRIANFYHVVNPDKLRHVDAQRFLEQGPDQENHAEDRDE